jgi:hypothetical protein
MKDLFDFNNNGKFDVFDMLLLEELVKSDKDDDDEYDDDECDDDECDDDEYDDEYDDF